MSSPHRSPQTMPPQGRKIAPLPLRVRARRSGTPDSLQNILSTDRIPSPHLSPPTVTSQERKIASLPLRVSSRRSGTPDTSQSVLITNGTPSPSSSSDANQSFSAASDISHLRGSYQSPDTTLNVSHFLPPAPNVPRTAFQFGQQGSSSPPIELQETYTLRPLHNITPRQSPEPEDILLPAFQVSPEGLNYSSLPEITTPDHEISQPVHTIYSDERIAIPGASSPLERDIPIIIEDHSDTTDAKSHASSTKQPTLLSRTQVSDLSPSLGGLRRRSISDASDVSNNNENNNSTGSYDVRDEEAPLEPFFTSAFQTALKNGLGIANKVVSAIEKLVGSLDPSSDLERLFKDARRLGTFQSSDTRTIAVLGDSGEGNCSFR